MQTPFAELLLERARELRWPVEGAHHPEPLAALDPGDELRLKREVLKSWWRSSGLSGVLEPIVAAPQPRGYRTTSKRRARVRAGELALELPGLPAAVGQGVTASVLDAPGHGVVYGRLRELLVRPAHRALVGELSWVVIRGSDDAQTLILNLRRFDAPVIRSAKRLGDELQAQVPTVKSLLLYLDPSDSEYYLEAKRPAKALSLKRIFGSETFPVTVDGVRLRAPAVSFSQVNAAMLPTMVGWASDLLGPLAGQTLLDLYCGYGLFCFTVGRGARRVVGVDHDGPAIAAAQDNARHLGRSVRFIAGAIEPDFLTEKVRREADPEVILLDPPRQGTSAGVVAALAARDPERVLHICCGLDELPREITSWRRGGMRVARAVPLDLFAGTANLETLVLLEPAE